MAKIYNFAGQQIVRPGSYTQRSFPANQGGGNSGGKVLILGEAVSGGVPYTVSENIDDIINIISGQAQALSVFGGGDLYYGAEFFLLPSNDSRFNTPSEANCIVVNQMTQAKTALKNSATEIIDIAFGKYGTDGNQAAVQIGAGSNLGKLISLIYKGNTVLSKDDVSMPMMSIQYTGTGSAATLAITATKITSTVTGATGDNLDITLANFSDLGSLINFIDAMPNYVCTLTGKSDESPLVFDAVATADVKTAPYEAQATVEAIIRALNASEGFTATLHTGSTRLVPDNLSAPAFLSGGTVTAATTEDWTAVLTKLEKYDCDNIVVMSGSATIQNLVNAHVSKMNGVKARRYRQFGAGAGSATATKALRIAQMKALGSAYAEYCVSPFSRFDFVQNKTREFDPYYLYAMIAGLRYSNEVGMDVVFKYVNIVATPQISDADIDAYLAAGATIVQKTGNVLDGSTNFEIVGNNTCYQGSVVTRTNPSCVYAVNKLTKHFEESITEKLRDLRTVANSLVISTIQNWILTVLFPKYRDDFKWITDSTDANGKATKAFDGVSFGQEGEEFKTTATLYMSVSPRYAFNFLTFITPGQGI